MYIIVIAALVLVLGYIWSQNRIWRKCTQCHISARDFFDRNPDWIMANGPPSKSHKGPFTFYSLDWKDEKTQNKIEVYYIGDQNEFKGALEHLDSMLFPC